MPDGRRQLQGNDVFCQTIQIRNHAIVRFVATVTRLVVEFTMVGPVLVTNLGQSLARSIFHRLPVAIFARASFIGIFDRVLDRLRRIDESDGLSAGSMRSEK